MRRVNKIKHNKGFLPCALHCLHHGHKLLVCHSPVEPHSVLRFPVPLGRLHVSQSGTDGLVG